MSRIGTIARRTFLLGSAVMTGGVAFGIYYVRRPHTNPLLDQLEEGEATFNPWIKINSKSITLIAPHTDLGQGARSLQAALIAEELDVELDQCTIEPGKPSAAYWNTALAHDGAPFLPRDHSLAAEATRSFMSAALKLVGLQITGGSSTTTDSYERLRIAGAVARETLKHTAAHIHKVNATELRTEKGAVLLPDGTSVPYVALAEAAAQAKPITSVSLKPPSEWRLISKKMKRTDIVGKSTGTTRFGIDLTMENMVHATIRLNPRLGGPMIAYDADTAISLPGVHKVLEVTDGVAVVADSTWSAMNAAATIQVEWGPAPYPAEMAEHWDTLQQAFREDNVDGEWRNDGDIETALKDATDSVNFEYRAPYLAHAPLEPLNATVRVTDERVDVWVAHQMPRHAETKVAEVLKIDVAKVHLHNQFAGGSFGHRLEFENVRYAAEIAQQLKGTAVKLTFSREEDFAHDFPRQIGMARATGSIRESRIEALDIEVATPSVVASQFARAGTPLGGPDGQIPAGIWTTPYAIPHLRVRAYAATGLAPVSSWRSVGASTGGFFIESVIDELIRTAGKDPLEERLRMCSYPLATKVLEAVGEMSNWGSPLEPGRGRGVAMVLSFGVPTAEVVEVTHTPAGIRIDKAFLAVDVGKVLDPINFDNQAKGGVIWGLGHAMNCETTFSDGRAHPTNYHQFEGLRLHQCPDITVRALENSEMVRGIGEPPVPPAAPALANAIFAATGQRIREMPFNRFIDFV